LLQQALGDKEGRGIGEKKIQAYAPENSMKDMYSSGRRRRV